MDRPKTAQDMHNSCSLSPPLNNPPVFNDCAGVSVVQEAGPLSAGRLEAPAARGTGPRRNGRTSRAERSETTAASLAPSARQSFLKLMEKADLLMAIGRSRGRNGAGANQVAAAKQLRAAARAIARDPRSKAAS